MINTQIQRLKRTIVNAQAKIKQLQDSCSHIGLEGKYEANTGNWCKEDDSYWVVFSCPVCEKRWTEDQAMLQSGSVSNQGFKFSKK